MASFVKRDCTWPEGRVKMWCIEFFMAVDGNQLTLALINNHSTSRNWWVDPHAGHLGAWNADNAARPHLLPGDRGNRDVYGQFRGETPVKTMAQFGLCSIQGIKLRSAGNGLHAARAARSAPASRSALGFAILTGLAVLCAMSVALAGPISVARFAVISATSAAGGLWDYGAIDAKARRLYLSTNGVLVLDLRTGRSTPSFVHGRLTHGITTLQGGTVAVADGPGHTVIFFDGRSGRILAKVPTGDARSTEDWHDPDALVFEPETRTLVAVDGDSGKLVLIAVGRHAVEGTIPVGGRLEFVAADGNGVVYVNVESRSEVAAVDLRTRRVVRRMPLEGCQGPTGLAYDARNALVISACDNGVGEFLAAHSGMVVARVRIGRGCDGVMLDPLRGLAFFPAGDDGTLTMVKVRGPDRIRIVQRLKTVAGARLGVLDPATGELYLPVVTFDPAAPPIRLPGLGPIPRPVPGSFRFLVVGRKRD